MRKLPHFAVILILVSTAVWSAPSTTQSPLVKLLARLDQLESRVDSMIQTQPLSRHDELNQVCAELCAMKATLALIAQQSETKTQTDSLLAFLCAEIERMKVENLALKDQVVPQEYVSLDDQFVTGPSGAAPAVTFSRVDSLVAESKLQFSGIFDAAGSFDNNSRRTDFKLNQLEGDLEQELSPRVSFRADAELNYDGPSSYSLNLEQGYVTFRPTASENWSATVGRFNSPIGVEQSDPAGSYLYTRGFIYNYALPTDLTGLSTTITLNKRWNLSLLAVDGWNSNSDNNNGKSLGLSTSLNLGRHFSTTISSLSGPEQDENVSSLRTIIDGTITFAPTESDYLSLEVHQGMETKALVSGGTAKWSGAMLAAHTGLYSNFSLSGRVDHFRDRDGNRTGVVQNLTGLAIAPTYSVPSGPDLVLEFRQNWSNQASFGELADQNSQFDMSLEVTLGF